MRNYRTMAIFAVAAAILTAVSCDKYEDYVKDFDYSAVYFGSQKPLRTLVARDGSDLLEFKAGVALGGVRENTRGYWATFEIDESLLGSVDGASGFTVLPEECYTMEAEDNRIVIPKGKFIGDFPVKIDKKKFTALAGATGKIYALPLRIAESSADSILRGNEITAAKDYTVIVIKYILEKHGTYYVKGKQWELDASDEIVEGSETVYSQADLSKNRTRTLTTLSAAELEMGGLGDNMVVSGANTALLTFTEDGPVLSRRSAAAYDVEQISSSYDSSSRTFTLVYKYVKEGKTYKVDEQLIIRQDPEKELRYEEW